MKFPAPYERTDEFFGSVTMDCFENKNISIWTTVFSCTEILKAHLLYMNPLFSGGDRHTLTCITQDCILQSARLLTSLLCLIGGKEDFVFFNAIKGRNVYEEGHYLKKEHIKTYHSTSAVLGSLVLLGKVSVCFSGKRSDTEYTLRRSHMNLGEI